MAGRRRGVRRRGKGVEWEERGGGKERDGK